MRLPFTCSFFLIVFVGCSVEPPKNDDAAARSQEENETKSNESNSKLAAVGFSPDRNSNNVFVMSIDAEQIGTNPSEEESLTTAQTELKYSWITGKNKAELIFHSMKASMQQDGQQTMNVFTSRDHFELLQNGQQLSFDYDEANPNIQARMHDSFDTPMWELKLHKNGDEIRRKATTAPGAQQLLSNITNATLFHVRFHPTLDEWESEKELQGGNLGVATGTFMYQKLQTDKESKKVEIEVTGELTNEGSASYGEVKNAEYCVKGTQTYDLEMNDWVSGNLTIEIRYELYQHGELLADVEGTMMVVLRTEEKKVGPTP